MTVEELIEYLQKQALSEEVGFTDHYGEFHPLKPYQIGRSRKSVKGIQKGKPVIVIEPPDFGPEPD